MSDERERARKFAEECLVDAMDVSGLSIMGDQENDHIELTGQQSRTVDNLASIIASHRLAERRRDDAQFHTDAIRQQLENISMNQR